MYPYPKHPQNMNSAELGNTNLQKHTQPELTNLPAGSNPYDHQQHSLYQTTDLWMQLETYKKPGASLVKDPLLSHAKVTHADEQTNFLPPLCQQSTTSIPQEVPRIFSFRAYGEEMAFTCILRGSHHNSGQQKRSTQRSSEVSASGQSYVARARSIGPQPPRTSTLADEYCTRPRKEQDWRSICKSAILNLIQNWNIPKSR